MSCPTCRKCQSIPCYCNEPQYVTDAKAAAISAATSAAMVANDLIEVENLLAQIEAIVAGLSVTDTPSLDLTLTGLNFSGDVNVSGDPGNALSIVGDGLYVSDTPDNLSCFKGVSTEAELIAANTGGVGGILVNAAITLTAALNITIPIYFSPCGSIVTNGNVLTISDSLSAGFFQIFNTVSGEVLFATDSVPELFMEWFGAKGDGVTDDTVAVQATFDSARRSGGAGNTPIHAFVEKNYVVSNIIVPDRATIFSEGFRNTNARFIGIGSGVMFSFGGSYIRFCGLIIDGQNLYNSIIDLNGADQSLIERCSFANATVGIDSTNGSIRTYIDKCKFGSTFTYPINISAITNALYIQGCVFEGVHTNSIHTEAAWAGDTIVIEDCTFDTSNLVQEDIRLEAVSIGGVACVIQRCRFDGAKVNSHVHIGQFHSVMVRDSTMTGNMPNCIVCDGQFCIMEGNYLHNAVNGIRLAGNSDRNRVEHNFPNGVTTYVVDVGSRNSIFRRVDKGITASRPVLNIFREIGALYLDTTLNANGKPIFWNGVAWVDGTGAIV